MALEVSNAARIVALHAQGLNTRTIAFAVYALSDAMTTREIDRKMAYVRVVIRQRQGKGRSRSRNDERYLIKRYGGKTVREAESRKYQLRRKDPVFRAKERRRGRDSYLRKKVAHVIEHIEA